MTPERPTGEGEGPQDIAKRISLLLNRLVLASVAKGSRA